jgi:hypothetical protein
MRVVFYNGLLQQVATLESNSADTIGLAVYIWTVCNTLHIQAIAEPEHAREYLQRAGRAQRLYTQSMGRALRTVGDMPVILDYVDGAKNGNS